MHVSRIAVPVCCGDGSLQSVWYDVGNVRFYILFLWEENMALRASVVFSLV